MDLTARLTDPQRPSPGFPDAEIQHERLGPLTKSYVFKR